MRTMSDYLIRSALLDNFNYQGDYVRNDCIHPIKGGITIERSGNKAEIVFDQNQQRVFFRWIKKRSNFKK